MRKVLLPLIFLSFLFGYSVAWSAQYVMGVSSVDHGEIRWGGKTTYSAQLTGAINTWNAMGKIKILPDTATTTEDLTISDVAVNGVGWYGVWIDSYWGADSLQVNTALLKNATLAQKQNTITHELGHSLGLDHYDLIPLRDNVMFSYLSSKIVLGAQDKSDYRFLHGY